MNFNFKLEAASASLSEAPGPGPPARRRPESARGHCRMMMPVRRRLGSNLNLKVPLVTGTAAVITVTACCSGACVVYELESVCSPSLRLEPAGPLSVSITDRPEVPAVSGTGSKQLQVHRDSGRASFHWQPERGIKVQGSRFKKRENPASHSTASTTGPVWQTSIQGIALAPGGSPDPPCQ